jgi:hypothetical protein
MTWYKRGNHSSSCFQTQTETLDVLGRLVHEFKLKEQPRHDDVMRAETVAYTQAQVWSPYAFNFMPTYICICIPKVIRHGTLVCNKEVK